MLLPATPGVSMATKHKKRTMLVVYVAQVGELTGEEREREKLEKEEERVDKNMYLSLSLVFTLIFFHPAFPLFSRIRRLKLHLLHLFFAIPLLSSFGCLSLALCPLPPFALFFIEANA